MEGFPWDDLRKILRGGQMMAKVHNDEEILPKSSTPWVGLTNVNLQTDNIHTYRQTDDRRFATANTRMQRSQVRVKMKRWYYLGHTDIIMRGHCEANLSAVIYFCGVNEIVCFVHLIKCLIDSCPIVEQKSALAQTLSSHYSDSTNHEMLSSPHEIGIYCWTSLWTTHRVVQQKSIRYYSGY